MTRLGPLLVLAALGVAAPAIAQTKSAARPDGTPVDEARQHFQRGVELYHEGSLDAALAEFTKAYALAPNYRVLYNLAQVQNERHDFVAALRLYQQYLEEGGDALSADRREQVTRDIAALQGRVAKVTVGANVAGAELLIDGVPAGTLPLGEPVLVNAGLRQLQVRKVGFETATRTETVADGDAVRVDVELDSLPVAPAGASAGTTPLAGSTQPGTPDAHPSLRPAGHASRAPVWISLIATGLLSGGAASFGVLTHQANNRLDQALGTFPGNESHIDTARSELKRDALVTDVLTAGAVASGGLFLYFAFAGSSPSSGDAAKERTGHTIRVSPAGKGVQVSGAF
jgi:tetratricopeptide (TPR) repeat protein